MGHQSPRELLQSKQILLMGLNPRVGNPLGCNSRTPSVLIAPFSHSPYREVVLTSSMRAASNCERPARVRSLGTNCYVRRSIGRSAGERSTTLVHRNDNRHIARSGK